MKNKQKTLSFHTKFAASVALRVCISKGWNNRRRSQQIQNVSGIAFWNDDIKQNISALREIRDF
jgi:hypothetical protein